MRRMIGSLLAHLCSETVRSGVCIIVWSMDPERTDISYHFYFSCLGFLACVDM